MPSSARSPERTTGKKLTEQIYELLKTDIIECRLEPGELLLESAVRERYSIGHTPFREACHRLAAEGLIQILPHRGYYVASFSKRDIRDLFELRLKLEPWAAELACQRGQPQDLARLEEVVGRIARLSEERPPQSFREVNRSSMEFHVGVARLSGNLELQNIIESLHTKLMRIIMFTTLRSPEDELIDPCHAQILDAIRAGNPREARRLMVKDIVTTRDWIKGLTR
jgi:DNA-binding GntR family transcriptional regulator